MAIHVSDEIEELREEVAELRAEIRQAMRQVGRRAGRNGSGVALLRDGFAHHASRLATDFVGDTLSSRAHLLREPMERAIVRHPLAAAAAALTATVLLQRYIGLMRVARAAALAAGWRLRL